MIKFWHRDWLEMNRTEISVLKETMLRMLGLVHVTGSAFHTPFAECSYELRCKYWQRAHQTVEETEPQRGEIVTQVHIDQKKLEGPRRTSLGMTHHPCPPIQWRTKIQLMNFTNIAYFGEQGVLHLVVLRAYSFLCSWLYTQDHFWWYSGDHVGRRIEPGPTMCEARFLLSVLAP